MNHYNDNYEFYLFTELPKINAQTYLNKGNIDMKTKATLLAVLLSATGTTLASGLSIDSVDVSNVTPTNVEITEINAQAPIDAFNVNVENNDKVDTSALKQSYNGKS